MNSLYMRKAQQPKWGKIGYFMPRWHAPNYCWVIARGYIQQGVELRLHSALVISTQGNTIHSRVEGISIRVEGISIAIYIY
jgi:hypothetical protein